MLDSSYTLSMSKLSNTKKHPHQFGYEPSDVVGHDCWAGLEAVGQLSLPLEHLSSHLSACRRVVIVR